MSQAPHTPSLKSIQAYLDPIDPNANKVSKGAVGLVWSQLKQRPWSLFFGMCVMALTVSMQSLEPWILGKIIDSGITPKDAHLMRLLTLSFLGATSIRVLSMWGQTQIFENIGQSVAFKLRRSLFQKIQKQPFSVFDREPAGKLMTRVTNDVSTLSEMFSAGFVSMLGNSLYIVSVLVWLVVLNVKLGLIVLAIFPLMVGAGVYFSNQLSACYRDSRRKLSALNAFLAENFMGIRVTQAFGKQERNLFRFSLVNDAYTQSQVETVRMYALFQPTITFVSGLTMAVVIFGGSYLYYAGEIKVGILVTYFSYAFGLFQPVRELADKWNTFLSGMASAERIDNMMAWPEELETVQQSVAFSKAGKIEFRDVWFAYQDQRWVLRGLNLNIKAGERIGVVGHTGAGKTTLMGLLLRFYEFQRGDILIDGVSIRSMRREDVRKFVGFVQQDAWLFSGTLEDNLSFWKGLSDSEKSQIAQSQLLSKPLNEEVLERGNNFSSGEKQSVALSRVMIRKPGVWIFDEPTAHMDSQTEKSFDQMVAKSTAGKTVMTIAHRLATVRSMDRILVLHKGELVENGTHRELLEKNGIYARLWRLQQSEDELENIQPQVQHGLS